MKDAYVEVRVAIAVEDDVAGLDVHVRLPAPDSDARGGGRDAEEASELRVQPYHATSSVASRLIVCNDRIAHS